MKNNPVEIKKKHITIANDNYLENLDYYFMNYENILSGKFSRNRGKKNNKEKSGK